MHRKGWSKMVEQMIARKIPAVQRALRPFLETVMQSPFRDGQPMIADFMTGDPQEPPHLAS